jgi:nitrite reductase/ring-hydroxylating ferredoxin subunit
MKNSTKLATAESTQATTPEMDGWIQVGTREAVRRRGCTVVSPNIAVFDAGDEVHAVDNRCPHMGFPLNRGTVQEGVLTCHWHHARFDLRSGGTFDAFADDVRAYPTRVIDGMVWVDPRPATGDRGAYWKGRLQDSLEQNISLVSVKSVLALLRGGTPPREILEVGGAFGARYRRQGWGPGLTILTAMANVLPTLTPDDQVLALYQGMVHVANDADGQPPRFSLEPLPTADLAPARLKAWFRRFIEVRDSEGAERVLLTAIGAGMDEARVADMLLAACTDHYFLAGGHTLDFINKAFEYARHVGWQEAATVLPSLLHGLATAQRSEELNSWRYPVDLVALLEPIVAALPDTIAAGAGRQARGDLFMDLVPLLLGDDPAASASAIAAALADGWTMNAVAMVLAYAAALRVARFHVSNEFSDWITVLHTFTYCNALRHNLQRAPSAELARGLFHGAMRLYLDRFLNMPAARLPGERTLPERRESPAQLLTALDNCFDLAQQVDAAADVAYHYLEQSPDVDALIARLGHLLLREDGEFHSYQMLEAGVSTYGTLRESRPAEARHVLIAVTRYLAAHAPTSREMMQTARTAMRLARGEALWEGDES